ncbi:YitT family protein [Fodinibacter luteus]|uniref:YitT family protein n=1 Tax=Fodinibacter luteus TaxID=552064 RepID=A0ABP8KL79_9MICO
MIEPAPLPVVPARSHSLAEQVAGLATGAVLASLGLFVLDAGGATTGGTAGLALLLARVSGWSFTGLLLVVSLPFIALAISRKGWAFTLRSAAALSLVAGFSALHPHAVGLEAADTVYAALVGNLLAGVGILVVFRHGSSLGGFNVVALLCQERLGWPAGYVQMVLDVGVVLAFAAVGDLAVVLATGAGAVLLNLVIAMNHRPGRYTGI